jgi:UDP-N-acetylglucosamine--N-acetylmuramyl-(pentapeptide) pyrophosphoryl-undecaprenol N-acetylglucosamine transferase
MSIGAYVIAAGGTGGHVFPGIALAEELHRRRPEAKIVFVGTASGLENKLVPAAGFELERVSATGFMGKSLSERFGALRRLPRGVGEARKLLKRLEARAVAGMGGYVSVPVLLAARSLKIPILIHEPNAHPGLANRLLNRFASRTAVGFEAANEVFKRKGVVTGTPVREPFFAVPPLDPAAPTRRVLVFGGSQGSRVLNGIVARDAPNLQSLGLEVIHQTGEQEFAAAQKRYYKMPRGFRLLPFLPKMWEEFAWADLIICRAGALTVAELAAAGRPAILVPLGTSTEGHQLANARAMAGAKAAVIMPEAELERPNHLAAAVERLFTDRGTLVKMGESARRLARPLAAKQLFDLLLDAEING